MGSRLFLRLLELCSKSCLIGDISVCEQKGQVDLTQSTRGWGNSGQISLIRLDFLTQTIGIGLNTGIKKIIIFMSAAFIFKSNQGFDINIKGIYIVYIFIYIQL